MYEEGLVSVVIPTYKRSEKLQRAVNSVLMQTYRKIEVLVVSDNEPDDDFTAEAKRKIESIGDPRAKLILQEHHKNGAAARNAGIRAAKGEYIAFLDDDDYWEKEKIDKQVELLSSLDETWGGVTCRNKHYSNGELVGVLPPLRKDGWICRDIIARLADVSTCAILLRHTALDKTGYFDERLKRHQEVQLMAFFSKRYKIKQLDMPLVCVDSTEAENQPTPERMKEIKKDFFEAIEPIMLTFTKSEQKDIYRIHNFELGQLHVRAGKYREGVKLCLSAFGSPRSFTWMCRYIAKKVRIKMNRERQAG